MKILNITSYFGCEKLKRTLLPLKRRIKTGLATEGSASVVRNFLGIYFLKKEVAI